MTTKAQCDEFVKRIMEKYDFDVSVSIGTEQWFCYSDGWGYETNIIVGGKSITRIFSEPDGNITGRDTIYVGDDGLETMLEAFDTLVPQHLVRE